MASSKVTVDEKDILLLFRDFLEESGQYESLIPFERSTGLYPRRLSAKFVSMREAVLWGDLDELQKHIFEPFRNLGYENESRECKYAIAKQRYLESLLQIKPDKADLQEKLAEVEKLCPSSEEFKALLSLLTLPSLSASPEYKEWNVQKGRFQCFHQLASLTSKVFGLNESKCGLTSPSSLDSPEKRLSKNRLVQLIAKGLLYEQCEAICSHPSTSGQATQEDTDSCLQFLDLYNWIKQQPDSAFQLSPATLQLQVCCKPSVPREESSERSKDALSESMQPLLSDLEEPSHTGTDSDSNKQTSTAVGNNDESVPCETRQVELNSKSEVKVCNESKSEVKAAQAEFLTANSRPRSLVETRVSASSDSQVATAKLTPDDVMRFRDNFVDGSPETKEEAAMHKEGLSQPSLMAKLNSEANLADEIIRDSALPSAKSAPLLPALLVKQTMRFEDNFIDESGTVTVDKTPPRDGTKKGRKSSTPKPSSSGEMTQEPPSFSTSPVPHVSSVQQDGIEAAEENHTVPSAKRLIDFSENLEESVVFPTTKLLAHVKDKQAVRSVAFSKSGSIVAIGANSRTLRVCFTEPLLKEISSDALDEELPAFYCQQHYHKGSIYCTAWWEDSLLASGSNDQKIRLLSYNPTSQTSVCSSLGQMRIHNGTIRDLTFTSDGFLVSGGVGDNLIKVSNPLTFQVTNTLFGHYDQILGLFVVKENIIASASQDKTVRLWDLRIGHAYASINLPHAVTSIAADTHLNQLACAQLDGSCAVHDLNTLKLLSTYNAHTDECRTVRYSSSMGPSPWLLTGSYDGTICLADTKTFEWQQVAQHGDKVIQCRWHGSETLFASTGADNKACFWRLATL